MLGKEKDKLKQVDAFMVLEYIRSSIEILMNLKIEEHEYESEAKERKRKKEKILEAKSVDELSETDE
jgi:hypothetical protein